MTLADGALVLSPLICGLVSDMPATEMPGSARARCACGRAVWISSGSWPWVKAGNPIQCVICAVAELASPAPT